MAITITLNPNVQTYVQGDAPITVTMGAGTASGPEPFWESNNGTFADRFAASTVFTPNNATKVTSIIGNRVTRFALVGSSGTPVVYGTTGGLGKSGGNSALWDTWAVYANAVPSGTGTTAFFEQESVGNNTEKALGFISNSSFYPNPSIVGGVGAAFEHSWHMYADGTAIPRKLGSSLTVPVPYKANDRFRVTLTGTQAIYTLNGVVVAIAERVASVPLYAYSSWKTANSYFTNVSFLATAENQGVATLSVTGLFPVQPNFAYNISTDIGMISSVAIDGTEKRRKKSRDRKLLNVQFNQRPYFEYQLINDFWNAHEKHEKFIYTDLVMGESWVMRFDAPLTVNVLSAGIVDIQATLKEV